MKRRIYPILLSLLAEVGAPPARADTTYDFVYSGRLTDGSGKPYDGPVAMSVSFFRDAAGETKLLTVTNGLTTVPLQQGIFQIKVTLSASDYGTVFSDVAHPVYVQITDLTHSPAAPFPLQQISTVPYAAKIPIDGVTLTFNSEGQLTALPQPQAQPGLPATGGTLSGALTVSAGGESLVGGLNNNSGGISNAGSILGVGANLTGASAVVVAAGGTAQTLTLKSSTTGSVNVGSGNGTSLSVLDGGPARSTT